MVQFTAGPNGYNINDLNAVLFTDDQSDYSVLSITGSVIVEKFIPTGETFDLVGTFDLSMGGGFVTGGSLFTSGGTLEGTLGGINQTLDQLDAMSGIAGIFAGNDTLTGSAGDDVLTGYAGSNTLNGGGGTNTLDYSAAPGGISLNFSTGQAANGYGGTDTFSNFQSVVGSAFNDVFVSGPGPHTINGGGGSNSLNYTNTGGAVTVNASTGTASSSFGTDHFSNISLFVGGSGNDVFIGGSSDTFIGGAGNNSYTGGTVSYFDAPAAVTVNLSNGQIANGFGGTDTVSGISGVKGSPFNDTFLPGAGTYTITGGGGFDTLDYSAVQSPVTLSVSATGNGFGVSDPLGGSYSFNNIGRVLGTSGNDTFRLSGDVFEEQNFSLDGSGGTNMLDWSQGGFSLPLNLANDTLGQVNNAPGTTFSNFQIFHGTGVDSIIAGPGNHAFIDTTSDTIDYSGAAGPVTANFATGTVTSSFGTDTYTNQFGLTPLQAGSFTTGNGDDVFTLPGTTGLDGSTLNGGGGMNTMDFSGATSALSIVLGTGGNGQVSSDGYFNFENFESVKGSSANDTMTDSGTTPAMFEGGGGNDSISGANATAVYTGDYSDYTIDWLANGVITVTDNRANSPDGTDTLTDVSHLAFADQLLVATYTAASNSSSYMWHMEDLPASQDVSAMVQAFAGLPGGNAGSAGGAIHEWGVSNIAPPPVAAGAPVHSPLAD